MEQKNVLLRFNQVGKAFEGNQVLKNITFDVAKGEIVGLVGENGAGKSTLMNILFGMSFIHETGGFTGEVEFDGQKVAFKSPIEALKAGIGMVHQEFSLIPGFTVTDNILLNMELTKANPLSVFSKKLKTLDRPAMKASASRALETLGVDIDPDGLAADMPVGYKQFIEIAREINKEEVKLIIMDEPTAVLTESEADILIAALRKLAERGISIIFISHRLREIITVCDKAVVLRDGEIIESRPTSEVTVVDLASWMVGRAMSAATVATKRESAGSDEDIILDVKKLWVDMPGELVSDVNLKIRRGEIFGIGGLAGQGKLGVPNGIMGLYPAGGEVLYNGKPLNYHDALAVLKEGLAFVSEDRRGVGLLLDEGIDWNISFNVMQTQDKFLKKIGPFAIRDDKAIKACAESYIEQLEIRCTGPTQKARNLSGGNQQKVCLAKAFVCEPDLLFVSEPTRGIDVGAKQLVLDALRRYNKERGTTIVMISSELEELRSICDRIALVYEGKVFGTLPPDAPIHHFGLMMAGENPEDEQLGE